MYCVSCDCCGKVRRVKPPTGRRLPSRYCGDCVDHHYFIHEKES